MIDLQAIESRKAEVADRLASLRQERGAALLDGRPFDSNEMDRLTAEQFALDEAEAESVNRERSANAAKVQQHRRAVAKQLAADNAHREASIMKAQEAASELGAALAEIMSAGDACVTSMRLLGRNPSTGTGREDTAIRYAARLAMAFLPVTGTRRRFGPLHFPEPRQGADWLDDERRIWAAEFSAIEKMEL